MNIRSIGRLLRAERKRQQLRQDQLAALAAVGTRFVSDLENGKPGAEFGRCLRVVAALGLTLELRHRDWSDIASLGE